MGQQQQQDQRFGDMPLREKIKVIENVSFFPALTVLIFIRQKLGFRMFKPDWLYVMTAILFILPLVDSTYDNHYDPLPAVYAIAMLGLGLWFRWKRWQDVCNGVVWHTYSPGISYLEKIKNMPPVLLRERRINRYIEPVLCLIIGLLLYRASRVLGAWVSFSALCLAIHENAFYQRMLSGSLDILDGIFEANVQDDIAKHFNQHQPDQKRFIMSQTAGIPTGIAADIDKQIGTRRRRPPPPDNLATDTIQPAEGRIG